MVINFMVHEINQGTHKLIRTPILIYIYIYIYIKKKKNPATQYPSSFYPESLSLCCLNEFYALSLSMIH